MKNLKKELIEKVTKETEKIDYRLTKGVVKDVLSVLAKLGYLNLPKHPLENNILQNPYYF